VSGEVINYLPGKSTPVFPGLSYPPEIKGKFTEAVTGAFLPAGPKEK
jgi:hypothetical protein